MHSNREKPGQPRPATLVKCGSNSNKLRIKQASSVTDCGSSLKLQAKFDFLPYKLVKWDSYLPNFASWFRIG